MKKTTCIAQNGPGSIYTGKSGRFENTKCYCETCNVTEARQTLQAARAANAPKIGAEPRKYKRPTLKPIRPNKLVKEYVGLYTFHEMLVAYCGNRATAERIAELMIARNAEPIAA